MDKARKWTDKKLSQMEKHIADIYKKSAKGILKNWNAYMKEAEKKVSELQKAYDDAKQTGDKDLIKNAGIKLSRYKKEVTLYNDQYKAMIDETTEQLANVNQIALAYVNDQMPSIYMNNFNDIKIDADNLGIQFGIVNEATVKRMVLDGDIELPYKNLDKIKDKLWNTKQLNSAVLQGILQGESMDKIAKRIVHITDNNEKSAIRNARTMVTGAENRGLWDSAKELVDEGAVVKRIWSAIGDSRTRDLHLYLDGQEVEIDEPFVDANGNKIDYPGDPHAAPETVYNCRCRANCRIVGFRKTDGRIEYVNYKRTEQTLHDKQIEEEKERRPDHMDNTKPDAYGPMKNVPKIKGKINAETVAKSANPNINRNIDYRAYSQNCANCVVAAEARYRGYDVIARARDFSRDSHICGFYYNNKQGLGSWTDSFENMIGEPVNVKRKNQIASAISDKMLEYGKDSRAVIFVQWDGKTVGHYFNVANENGKIIFFDPQNGSVGKDVEEYFMSVRPSQTRIWRTDDKEMTDFITKVVEYDG